MHRNIFMYLLLFSFASHGATQTAASASLADVTTAYNAASAGDTVAIPEDTATWTSMLTLAKSVIVTGAGVGKTMLVNGIDPSTLTDYLFRIAPTTPGDDPHIEIKNIRFDADSSGGCINARVTGNGTVYRNFRIHHNIFLNAGANGSGEKQAAIYTKGNVFGLVDYNIFTNNYKDMVILGNDDDSWTNFPAGHGGIDFLYIENNTSTGTTDMTIGETGEGARFVYRYNTVNASGLTNSSVAIDAHGDTNNRGVVAFEIYNNTFTNGTEMVCFVDYRGGSGIIFDNTLAVTTSDQRGPIRVREEANGGGCHDSINAGYIWNNRNSNNNGLLQIVEVDESSCITENTDWWDDGVSTTPDGDSATMVEPSGNFLYGLRSSRSATPSDDDCFYSTDTDSLWRSVGANNWTFVFSPYRYPHPLGGNRRCVISIVR